MQTIEDSRQKWEESRPVLRGIGLILLVVGLFLLLNGVYTGAQKYRTIGEWLPVDAVVLDFKLVNEPSGRVREAYRASFTFQYEVQGRTLVSGAQSDHTGSYASEVSDWMQYQRGRHQRIRYNPTQPQEITVDDYNVRSFREPLKLGGWGAALILLGLVLRR